MDFLRKIWVQPGSDNSTQTGFIVVGPIPECDNLQMTTGTMVTF